MEAKLIKHGHSYALLKEGKLVAFTHPEDFSNDHTIGKLSIKNCQAIERGYDLDELSETTFPSLENCGVYLWMSETDRNRQRSAFIKGFQKVLEILGDKKFSKENMLKAFITGVFTEETSNHDFEFTELMKDLQQTEWEVEVEMEYYDPLPPTRQTALRPKLDADGCLILKRK